MVGNGIFTSTYTSALSGLNFATTNILKITGTAAGTGAATNDILSKLAKISWNGVPQN